SPHYQNKLECNNCHVGHEPSENFCGQCHNFEYKVP
ncbi:cytochrome c3 family protein, partial [Turicimonas muris]